jgi:hypothetical protein
MPAGPVQATANSARIATDNPCFMLISSIRMVNCMFDELSFQARYVRVGLSLGDTLLAVRSLCCIDQRAVHGGWCGASNQWPPGPARSAGSPKAAPVEDVLNDRQRLFLDAAKVVAPSKLSV